MKQLADAAYARPTADDQRATATIPAEAWGKPVDGLRVAIVLRSPPIDKYERLCYDIVAENVLVTTLSEMCKQLSARWSSGAGR